MNIKKQKIKDTIFSVPVSSEDTIFSAPVSSEDTIFSMPVSSEVTQIQEILGCMKFIIMFYKTENKLK